MPERAEVASGQVGGAEEAQGAGDAEPHSPTLRALTNPSDSTSYTAATTDSTAHSMALPPDIASTIACSNCGKRIAVDAVEAHSKTCFTEDVIPTMTVASLSNSVDVMEHYDRGRVVRLIPNSCLATHPPHSNHTHTHRSLTPPSSAGMSQTRRRRHQHPALPPTAALAVCHHRRRS